MLNYKRRKRGENYLSLIPSPRHLVVSFLLRDTTTTSGIDPSKEMTIDDFSRWYRPELEGSLRLKVVMKGGGKSA